MARDTEPSHLQHQRLIQHRYKEPERSWFRTREVLSPPLTHYRVSIMDAQRKTYRSRKKFPWTVIPLAGVLLVFLAAGAAFYAQSLQNSHASGVSGRKALINPVIAASPTPIVHLNVPSVYDTAVTANAWTVMGSIQIAYVDQRMHVEYLSSTDSTNWQLTDLTQQEHAPLANGRAIVSYQWSQPETQQIAYIDTKNHIQLLSRGTSGRWQLVDLTRQASAPPSNGIALSGFEWLQFGTEQIMYIDGQQHVHELESVDGQHWNDTDLTKVTGAPLADGRQVRGFAWTAGDSKQVIYIDKNRHIQELRLISGGHWQWQDLTQMTSSPLANDNALAGYEWQATSTEIIDYIDQNNAIQELTSSPAGKWTVTNVTKAAGGPISNGQALTGFAWLSGGERDIAYVGIPEGRQGNLAQLSLQPGGQWQITNPEPAGKGSGLNGAILLGLTGLPSGSKQLIYLDTSQHIQVLKMVPQGNWQLVQW